MKVVEALEREAGARARTDVQLELRPAFLLPLARKQYAINEIDAVHAPASVDFRLFAGVVIDVR